jgi:inosine-uridine nucleoside N-ribohydrolase
MADSQAPSRLLIDTDTAGDDVTSLLFGLRWPDVQLEAITVCAGNVYLEQAVRNACYTSEIADRPDVPVHAGAGRPLLRPLVTAHYVHGDDGMGNSDFPPPRLGPRPEHAVDAIIECADRCGGELEIVAQAPLTNIALAVMRKPELPSQVKKLWIMGGSNNALGNITPAAEFNFYVDPEAAHVVLRAGFDVVLVPWDVCVNNGILLRDELVDIIAMDTKLSRFYLAVNRHAWEFMRTGVEGRSIDGIGHPDALTIAMALDRGVMTESMHCFVDVEHRGEATRGYSLVDVYGVLHEAPNAEVVIAADKDRFRRMLEQLLGG